MSLLTKLFSGGVKDVVNSVGTVLDDLITNKEELAAAKLAAEAEINRHMEKLIDQSNEIEKAYLADVHSARQLQMNALNQNDIFSKRFLYYLAGFIIVFTMAYGVILFFWEIPEANKRLIEMFLDIFVFSGSLSVIYFFFGSSKNPHDTPKQETINVKQVNQ